MYQALYRKYRPKDFDSVVGQEFLVKTLKNSINNKTFSHAYMFFGPRGTGKTTLSKIFARSVNCLNPKNGCACNECEMCKYSLEKECVDIIEIDAASNNGVDEIRELRNKISLVPSKLKYKVYIIDEVHMLSIGAFNALLKTLEEPPEHVIFILATTDPQKVPDTIISRCQCFSFERISEQNIIKRLKDICEIEKIDIDLNVLEEISISVDGGLRDALSVLDKLVSFSNEKITLEMFYELNGMISKKDINLLVDKIFSGNSRDFLNTVEEYNNLGKNIVQIIVQILYFIKDKIFSYYIDNTQLNYNVELLIKFINIINEKMFDIKKSGNPLIYIEMLILEFINNNILSLNNEIIKQENDNNIINKTLKDNKDNLHNKNHILLDNDQLNKNKIIDKNDKNKNNKIDNEINCPCNNNDFVLDDKVIDNLNNIMNIRVNNTFVAADKNILKNIQEKLYILNDFKLDDKIGYLACALLDGNIRAASNEFLIISYQHNCTVKQNLLLLEKLNSVLNEKLEINVKLAIISDKKWEEEKNNYKINKKNGIKYSLIEEPNIKVFQENKYDDIIMNAIDLFGDIVEID